MPKRTAIIDLGSRSFTLLIFERSSRFGFTPLREVKTVANVGARLNSNNELPLKDIHELAAIIASFAEIIKSLKARKTLCIATSAIRDAKNSGEFKNIIAKKTGINIKVISGELEAKLGAIAAINLLPEHDFVTMDIGGASTELSLVKDKKIVDCISLNIGTVRLKKMFTSEAEISEETGIYDDEEATKHIQAATEQIPAHFLGYPLISIGGSARAVCKIIMPKRYLIPVVHGYEFDVDELTAIYEKIMRSSRKQILHMNISSDRANDITMGMSIFYQIAKQLDISRIITSGVGVREGYFLKDMLRSSNGLFPSNFHIGIRSLEDRFIRDEKLLLNRKKSLTKLFEVLKPIHKIDDKYKKYLLYAISIFQSGLRFNTHKTNEFSSYLVTNSTIYNLSHQERMILFWLIKYSSKKLIKESDYKSKNHQPIEYDEIYWLSFIHMLVINLIFCNTKEFAFSLQGNILEITEKNKNSSLVIEQMQVQKIDIPSEIVTQIKD